MPQTATKLAMERQAPSPFADLVLGAKLELYACLQLLAERARFITGASRTSIGVREGEHFIYRAGSGNGFPEIGVEAELSTELSILHPFARPNERSLIAGVVQGSNIAAFIQLVSDSFEFGDEDLQAVSRLAGIVATAIRHMQAAEASRDLIMSQSETFGPQGVVSEPARDDPKTEDLTLADANQPSKPIPLLWHAPEGASATTSSATVPEKSNLAVRLCESCGFPVSPGRKVCMDCEEGGRIAPALFSGEEPSSWISNHGYTIASLLLPALAAALFYWLR
ncbi:MAG TPA: hypothetical protein VFA90_00630 [Terriglobales bacterium]|nr:hypothetical protein [Terriglobales bacterium]